MASMDIIVSDWFAKRLESVLENALQTEDDRIIRFVFQQVYPIFMQAAGQAERPYSFPEPLAISAIIALQRADTCSLKSSTP